MGRSCNNHKVNNKVVEMIANSAELILFFETLSLIDIEIDNLTGWLNRDFPVPSTPVVGLQKHHCTSFLKAASGTLKCSSLYSYMARSLVIGLYP